VQANGCRRICNATSIDSIGPFQLSFARSWADFTTNTMPSHALFQCRVVFA